MLQYMKVISANIGESKTLDYRGRKVTTGIFKYAVNKPIFLHTNGVANDKVIDLRYHGGVDKACYLYSSDHYKHWQKLYPDLHMQWGMFGENLSIEGLQENEINIGDIFQIGEAVVQATQPRQPCFKLEFRFFDKQIVKKFTDSGFAGVYVRVLEKGKVETGDKMRLIEKKSSLSIRKTFELLYANKFDTAVKIALENKYLADSCRKDLIKRWKDHL